MKGGYAQQAANMLYTLFAGSVDVPYTGSQVGYPTLNGLPNNTIHSLPPPCIPRTLQAFRPVEVILGPGDALVWFPGWEHETSILIGPAVSLSLHFTSPSDSAYQNTFSDLLSQRVSPDCKWNGSV